MKKLLIFVCFVLFLAVSGYAETIEAISLVSIELPATTEAASPISDEFPGMPKVTPNTGYVLMIIPQYNFVDSEYTIPKVIISRAGYTVEVASTSTREIAVGQDISKVRPNLTIEQIDTSKYKAVIYVGGYLSKKFFENKALIEKSKEFAAKGTLIGAMDNIPYFMAQWGILGETKVTVNKSLVKGIKSMGINCVEKNIVVDNNFITVDNQQYSDQFTTEFLTELNKR